MKPKASRPIFTIKVYKDDVFQFSEKYQAPRRAKWYKKEYWQFWNSV